MPLLRPVAQSWPCENSGFSARLDPSALSSVRPLLRGGVGLAVTVEGSEGLAEISKSRLLLGLGAPRQSPSALHSEWARRAGLDLTCCWCSALQARLAVVQLNSTVTQVAVRNSTGSRES